MELILSDLTGPNCEISREPLNHDSIRVKLSSTRRGNAGYALVWSGIWLRIGDLDTTGAHPCMWNSVAYRRIRPSDVKKPQSVLDRAEPAAMKLTYFGNRGECEVRTLGGV
jgi:hypothetical protein